MKLVCPAPETPAAGVHDSSRISGRLPDDVLSEQVRRLGLFSAVIGGLWAFGLFMDGLIVPFTVPGAGFDQRGIVLDAAGILVAAAMYCYVLYSSHPVQRKLDAGLGYMILNAVGVALLNTWVVPPQSGVTQTVNVSWIAILILVFSMISPSSPRKMLIASLVAASMDPLAVWFAHLRGLPVTPPWITMILFFPSYVCAVVALVPAHFLQRVSRRLREAKDLGSYQLIELLGRGGMGEVWRAQHHLLARSAAIKLVRPEVLGARNDAEARVLLRRFEREAQATAALRSPHTIHVFDFGATEEGTFYYVMELLEGRDLESLVREFGPLPADRAMYLLRQVCHSLADAHARGLVHRDIKPANIYVCRMGLDFDFVKVLDFGLVKIPDRSPLSAQTLLTVDHTTTGTPAYMAPEIILGEADVDSRADVYALGCVAYFLLTGQLVFEADTSMKMLMQHVNERPVPPSRRTELPVPRELDDLILACLEKSPDKRPQSAEELFNMAQHCRNCETWNRESAKHWWQTHLPEHTGPLSLTDAEIKPVDRTVAVV